MLSVVLVNRQFQNEAGGENVETERKACSKPFLESFLMMRLRFVEQGTSKALEALKFVFLL